MHPGFSPSYLFLIPIYVPAYNKKVKTMVSHFAIPSKKFLGGHLPYVFTVHGVLMLANVLKSERAIEVSLH